MREPEPETIRRARAGDLRAFESLVREYQGDVWRFAYHLTRNRTAAEDVTQEAFLRAYRGLDSYKGQAKFRSSDGSEEWRDGFEFQIVGDRLEARQGTSGAFSLDSLRIP